VDAGETCDPPGSSAGGNGNLCRGDCTVCGDGVVDAGESCDDGNGVDADGCTNDCTIPNPRCGDGSTDPGEGCDPPGYAAGAVGNVCRGDCTVCGDGVVNGAPGVEECDDGNLVDTDGCTNRCTIPPSTCGDGEVDPGETCDPPGSSAGGVGNTCRGDCTVCGDGSINGGARTEECDDGNAVDDDGCTNQCTVPPPDCGNDTVDPGETCDPPGSVAGGNGDECRGDCTVCGDGRVNGGVGVEECDDGNGVDGDGCSNACTDLCGNGSVDAGETCDPPGSPAGATGNLCRGTCTVCGDGIVDSGEQCDDGDTEDNDGCDTDCVLSETLVPTSGFLESGSLIVGDGTGLFSQPGSVTLEIPAGAKVRQVLVYWNGFHTTASGDDEILVDGTPVTGTLIGGPTLFFGTTSSSTYRADITGLGVVGNGPGTHVITLDGFDLDPGPALGRTNGASIIAVLETGAADEIELRDGQDLAFANFGPPLDSTVPQVFDFAPAPGERSAELTLLAGSVRSVSRPNVVRITIDGNATDLEDVFSSADGAEWDHLVLPVTIPAGVSSISVEVLSDEHGTGLQPASLAWVAAGLTVPAP
jgi:cysteine-rich repeat protein